MRHLRSTVIGITALVLMALGACLVWPTRYRYDHLRRGVRTFPVRIDRFTGQAEYFNGRWMVDVER